MKMFESFNNNNSNSYKNHVLFIIIVIISCCIRLFSSIYTNTIVIPDEYYQHYEPAYQIIYKNSIR